MSVRAATRSTPERIISTPPNQRHDREEIKRLLAGASVIRNRCDLDLLVFFHRHPRALLTNEQLAAFVGYDMKQVARVIDEFIEAGLLERRQNAMHAARMYLVVLEGPQNGGLRALLELASTRLGRREILQLLSPEQARSKSQAAPVDVAQEQEKDKRRLYAIA